MPTTIYSNDAASLSYNGKNYTVENGEVAVPDDAVDTLVETHGFSREPIVFKKQKAEKPAAKESETEDDDGDKIPDIDTLTRPELLAYANNVLQLGLAVRTSAGDAYDAVKQVLVASGKMKA